MWKERLKRLLPFLRNRTVVLTLHAIVDGALSLPARLRLSLQGTNKLRAANISDRSKRVVFISENPLRREPKFAYALKRAGWEVVLLRRRATSVSDFGDFVDVQDFSSPGEAKELAFKSRARVFHCFTASCDDTTLGIVDDKPGRVVVDFYDYFYALSDGLEGGREKFKVEIAGQFRCIEKADAICTPDLQLQYKREETRVARGKPLICFPNYCWNRQPLPPPRTDGEIRIAQIGWMHFEKNGEEDIGSFRVTKQFIDAGCHFHIFLHPGFPAIGTPEFHYLFSDYLDLAERTKRVHFNPTVANHLLVAELARFDFGFNMLNGTTYGLPMRHHNPAWLPLLASGRLFDYLDAGLPTLSDGDLAFNRYLFGPHAFIDGSELVRSNHIIDKLRKRPSQQQMLFARERLSVERNIHRLVKFYESL